LLSRWMLLLDFHLLLLYAILLYLGEHRLLLLSMILWCWLGLC
jgi:hypothetical protein